MKENMRSWLMPSIVGLFGVFIMIISGLNTFILTDVKADTTRLGFQITEVDERIITHQSNHELHVPRSEIVSQREFNIYQLSHTFDSNKRIEDFTEEIKDFIKKNK